MILVLWEAQEMYMLHPYTYEHRDRETMYIISLYTISDMNTLI